MSEVKKIINVSSEEIQEPVCKFVKACKQWFLVSHRTLNPLLWAPAWECSTVHRFIVAGLDVETDRM